MLVKSIVIHKYNNNFMYIAIAEAKKGKKFNEIPVGAVIVNSKGNIISKAYNCIEKKNNSTLHAEKIAIEKALIKTKKRYLEDCDIWVTLEPCMMCLGLIELTRIRRLYYGAADKNKGLISRNINFINQKSSLDTYSGIEEEKCSNLLNKFFLKLRQKS